MYDELIETFVARWHAGDVDGVLALYDPRAVLDVNAPGARFRVEAAGARDVMCDELLLTGRRLTDLVVTYTHDGAVVETEIRYTRGGAPRTFREAHVLRHDGRALVAHTIYCPGVWAVAA